jgi:hypothetical protein
MSVAFRAVHPVKLREQGTTVLMLDFPFQAQLAMAIPKCPSKLRFQQCKALDLLPHAGQLALEHRFDFRTCVMPLPQRQQFLHFGQRTPGHAAQT